MACYHPIPGWRARRLGASGKRPIVFSAATGFKDMPVELPCGKCIGCIQSRANEWAMRCEHEAKCWRSNWFITLTYDGGSLPPGGSLVLRDLQNFWKRLRKEYLGVRYFACGEYGERFLRPHYHALVFNWRPRDLSSHRRVLNDKVVYESKELVDLWGLGRVDIAPFSPAAAQYVCNYMRKSFSVGGSRIDFGSLTPPFQVMSRRPGIGANFLARFMHDIYPDGYVTRPGGVIRRAPRFYDLTLEKSDPRMFRKVKRTRKSAVQALDVSGSRMYSIEEGKERALAFFNEAKGRPYERE